MALGGEIVDLGGLDLLDQADDIRRVRHVPIMHLKAQVLLMGVPIEVVDSLGVEGRGAALDAVDEIALAEKQVG